jgi:hypothetical protein
MTSSDHPSDLGWRNPTHLIAGSQAASIGESDFVVVAEGAAPVATVRSVPRVRTGTEVITQNDLVAEARYPLLDIRSGPAESMETSAEAYSVWYRIALADGVDGWVPALTASREETGGDGRASALRRDFLVAD